MKEKKIQDDLVLKQGGRNLILLTKGGKQQAFCIELDFVPLWLAKISLTPSMQKKNPEAVEKLIKYQLKAQKVLKEAFVESEEKQREFFSNLGLQGEIIDLKTEIVDLKTQVNTLIDNSTINSHQAQKLNKLARQRVASTLGGVDSPVYKKKSRKYFKQLWLNCCDKFGVASYKDLNPMDFGNATNFISNWSYM